MLILQPLVSFKLDSVADNALECDAAELSVPAREIFRFLLGGVVLCATAAVSDIYKEN